MKVAVVPTTLVQDCGCWVMMGWPRTVPIVARSNPAMSNWSFVLISILTFVFVALNVALAFVPRGFVCVFMSVEFIFVVSLGHGAGSAAHRGHFTKYYGIGGKT